MGFPECPATRCVAGWSPGEGQATLEQEGSELVDHGGSSRDQPISNTVDGLQIQLVIGLNGNKAHVLALHGFGDRLGIHKVVLVGRTGSDSGIRAEQRSLSGTALYKGCKSHGQIHHYMAKEVES